MLVRIFYIKQVQNRLSKVDYEQLGVVPQLGAPDKWTPLMFEPSLAVPIVELPTKP